MRAGMRKRDLKKGARIWFQRSFSEKKCAMRYNNLKQDEDMETMRLLILRQHI